MSELPYLILFLLVVAFILRIDFIFYIVYVCVGVYVWSLWQTPRALTQLRLSRHFAGHAFLGERVSVTLRLHNEQWLLLPWLQFSESIPPELRAGDKADHALSLRPRQTAEFTYFVQASRRGFYRLGPLQLTAGDLFGFAERHARLAAGYLTVYPPITRLARLGLPSRLPFGTLASRQRLFEDPARPQGVRDYRSGDSLRQIHWKASGHVDRLVVKTFQPAISLETTILLNLDLSDYGERGRYDVAEWAIEVAASLATHLTDQRQAVGLISNGADPLRQIESNGARAQFDESSGRLTLAPGSAGSANGAAAAHMPSAVPPRGGRPHLMKVLEVLARVEPAPTLPFATWAPTACLHLSWGVTILAITPVGDLATCQMLHRLVRAGFNPVLIVVAPVADFGQVRDRARRLGFHAYQVAQRKALKGWQS
jgi:uncharacterized protein (DUF58 family)